MKHAIVRKIEGKEISGAAVVRIEGAPERSRRATSSGLTRTEATAPAQFPASKAGGHVDHHGVAQGDLLA